MGQVRALLAVREGTNLGRNPQIDPSLAQIVTAWAKLPEAIRKAMLALTDSGTA
jgi:hypothetical protein